MEDKSVNAEEFRETTFESLRDEFAFGFIDLPSRFQDRGVSVALNFPQPVDKTSVSVLLPIVDKTAGMGTLIYSETYDMSVEDGKEARRKTSGEGLRENILGVVLESPLDVLRKLFREYVVTSFNGYEMFLDFRYDNIKSPSRGIGISPYKTDYSKDGALSFLTNQEFRNVNEMIVKGLFGKERMAPISELEKSAIRKSLAPDRKGRSRIDPSFLQESYDKKQILDALGI